MAVGTFDILDGYPEWEYKVKQKYFTKLDLNTEDVPGMTYATIMDNFVFGGYFRKKDDGTFGFVCSKVPKMEAVLGMGWTLVPMA